LNYWERRRLGGKQLSVNVTWERRRLGGKQIPVNTKTQPGTPSHRSAFPLNDKKITKLSRGEKHESL